MLVTKFYYYILPGDGYYFFLYPYDPSFLYDDFRISTLWIGLPILAIIIGIAWWIRVSKKLTEHMIHLLVIIALGLSIFGYLLFLVSNERYVYTEHPALLGYRDWQGEYITDTDEYLALVQKYGFDI
ncbi:MAG: hypothetical protein H6767_01795 [Candidatus Peribacteria bacterium]|nr:MAG: hypothetical protein H6767_01795 [Candidatus Peribacteria bacterium]